MGFLFAVLFVLWYRTTSRYVVGLTQDTLEVVRLDLRGRERNAWSWPRERVQARLRGGWLGRDPRAQFIGPTDLVTMQVDDDLRSKGNGAILRRLLDQLQTRSAETNERRTPRG